MTHHLGGCLRLIIVAHQQLYVIAEGTFLFRRLRRRNWLITLIEVRWRYERPRIGNEVGIVSSTFLLADDLIILNKTYHRLEIICPIHKIDALFQIILVQDAGLF